MLLLFLLLWTFLGSRCNGFSVVRQDFTHLDRRRPHVSKNRYTARLFHHLENEERHISPNTAGIDPWRSTLSPSPISSSTGFLRRVDDFLDGISSKTFDSSKWIDSILQDIHRSFEEDKEKYEWLSPPPSSSKTLANNFGKALQNYTFNDQLPSTEWIYVPSRDSKESSTQLEISRRELALRTLEPIMDETTISLLRNVADDFWSMENVDAESSSSSFTYQRKGNCEAHLGDLCAYNATLKHAVQSLLESKIYPLTEQHFLHNTKDENSKQALKEKDWTFHIYDSLFIRYNATASNEDNPDLNGGAGQPLHRDLGVVSVNIMLNDASNFDGGGTFFEDQLSLPNNETGNEGFQSNTQLLPLKPSHMKGHALLHYSNLRHAGAGTTRGVRDILVFFLSASRMHTNDDSSMNERRQNIVDITNIWYSNIHPIELGARIKEKSKSAIIHDDDDYDHDNFNNKNESKELLQALKRTHLYRTAVDAVGTDGEAYHYLGTCLSEVGMFLTDMQSRRMANTLAVESLQIASSIIPNDGRLFNNFGLILGKQEDVDDANIARCFKRSLYLHLQCKAVGCDVQNDIESTALNYGLFLANRDQWEDAIDVLDNIDYQDCNDPITGRLRADAYRLRQFCAKQSGQLRQSSLLQIVQPAVEKAYNRIRRGLKDDS